MTTLLIDAVKKTNAFACYECGKCTGVCPVSRFNRQYSPRRLLTNAVREEFDELYNNYDLWSCLTCQRCDSICPANIQYIELQQIVRSGAQDSGFHGKCSHAGAMDALQKIITKKDLKQNRLDWVGDDLEIAEAGDVLYFVGCSPYMDVFFRELDVDMLDASSSSIKILNKLGITPVLMPDERCCGHDMLWNGDVDNFRMLAEHNLEAIEKTGAKTILFSCAECMSAFANLYPSHGYKVKPKLQHMSQFLSEKLESGEIQLREPEQNITYQDPCRLGRHLKILDEPRKVLKHGDGDHFSEMKQHGKSSLCCGVSGWMNCDGTSKKIQNERLKQAESTGAETLAVACPKCQIHLTCTMKDRETDDKKLKIQDIASITLGRMV